MDNVIALSYLLKMGMPKTKFAQIQVKKFETTCWPRRSQLSRIPSNCSQREIQFPVRDSSKWQLDPKVFQTICRKWELLEIYLFLPEFLIRSQHTYHGSWIIRQRKRCFPNMLSHPLH